MSRVIGGFRVDLRQRQGELRRILVVGDRRQVEGGAVDQLEQLLGAGEAGLARGPARVASEVDGIERRGQRIAPVAARQAGRLEEAPQRGARAREVDADRRRLPIAGRDAHAVQPVAQLGRPREAAAVGAERRVESLGLAIVDDLALELAVMHGAANQPVAEAAAHRVAVLLQAHQRAAIAPGQLPFAGPRRIGRRRSRREHRPQDYRHQSDHADARPFHGRP